MDAPVGTDEAFSVDVRQLDGVDLVTVRGDLDLFTVAALREAVNDPALCAQPTLLIDLHSPFIDSTGVAALVVCRRRAQARGATFVLACNQPLALQVLSMAGLRAVLEIHPSAATYLVARASAD